MKPVMATFLLLSLVLMSSLLQITMADSSVAAAPEGFCTPKCAVRCSKAGRQDRCLKYCMICCEECSCVPSGTSGNKDECPCYRDKKNSKGTSKCP